ncbi:interleukin-1 receptor accessory protein-like 1-A isoform X1 [Lethenteron reissneri]|uniref:interleukin-1 receptor accessory protein-like 1-A isoform X1 n=2 Tax=Lethenteron reissneri TaxID=7753 RepID=UPI002AB7CF67|nr:interleukin-1 receptor accessory protein-like 1-A isoform X1 [Lethenteron reissneri]
MDMWSMRLNEIQEIAMTLKNRMGTCLCILYLSMSANCLNYQSTRIPKNHVCSKNKISQVEALEGDASMIVCDLSNEISTSDATAVRWHKVSNDSSSQRALAFEEHRVVEDGHAVWFLPSHRDDQGLYVCHLQNGIYCINFTVAITENHLCYSGNNLYSLFTKIGKNKRLFCSHDNLQLSENANFTWYKNCSAIDARAEQNRGNELTIHNVTVKDAGKYTCEVHFHKFGRDHKASKTFSLQVTEIVMGKKPEILQPRKNNSRNVSLGQALNITCKVMYNLGHDLYPLVWWTSNGIFIEDNQEENGLIESSYRNVSSNETCSVIERTLTISKVQPNHLGYIFTCFAQNGVGMNSASVRLQQQCSSTGVRSNASKKGLYRILFFVLPFFILLL